MLVTVFWLQMPEYNGCYGMLAKMEYMEELKETMTVLKNVKCPDGKEYDYIVGINKSRLRPK